MSSTHQFFDEQRNESKVKAQIVADYFVSWARVLLPNITANGGKMAYVDLYAGPGRYKDGSASTPLLVLKEVIADSRLSQHVATYFNDADENNSSTLQTEINGLPSVRSLRFPPSVNSREVDKNVAAFFDSHALIPSFTFIDPWGYKGLSKQILSGVIKDWGCDCVFFFNYIRINAGIANPSFRRHMESLFGESRLRALQDAVRDQSPAGREKTVIAALKAGLREKGGKYVLSFRFQNAARRTKHHLVFVSKHLRGYDIMKEIMAKSGYIRRDGVPTFTFCSANEQARRMDLGEPLKELREDLLAVFSGQELTVSEVYQTHYTDNNFLKRNYKRVLLGMEEDSVVGVRSVRPRRRRAGTLADDLVVRFP